jgi:enoyl-[acyl-carrier protein] reductase I
MSLLMNKRGAIFGVADRHSIAWHISQTLLKENARLAFGYRDERSRVRLEKLTEGVNGTLIVRCDVVDQGVAAEAFRQIKENFGHLDFLIHSLAFAPREALHGSYVNTTREAFLTTLDISVYSLTELARAAMPLMAEGGSIVTMTSYGAEKAVPSYNVMGVAKAALEASVRYLAADLGQHNIRINAISSGPLNTLSARGIGHCSGLIRHHSEVAPLQRNIDGREVGEAALFLCSPLSSGITGEVLHVDCGYNIMASVARPFGLHEA